MIDGKKKYTPADPYDIFITEMNFMDIDESELHVPDIRMVNYYT